MEKINIAEILKDCPQGMELDCTMYDNVKLIGVDKISNTTLYPIKVNRGDGCTLALTKYGQYANADCAKCVIFPKGKTTWEGFVPPYKFKDGDIIFVKSKKCGVGFISIYKNESSSLFYDHCSVSLGTGTFYSGNTQGLIHKNDISISRLATKEEKEKLFKAIKDNGYKWNPETKTLEKLPKFKVGDRVKHTSTYISGIVVKVDDKGYYINNYPKGECVCFISFTLEEYYELVPNKFNIDTLKAFESRVLVRDKNTDEWRGQFFSHYYESKRSDKPYICIGVEGLCEYKQCIPYEGNEHLLGTTDDCADFYKTWK